MNKLFKGAVHGLIAATVVVVSVYPAFAAAKEKLDLTECIGLAVKNNYNLQVMKQKVEQAEAKQKQMEAGLGPQLAVSGTVDSSKDDSFGGPNASLSLKQSIGQFLPDDFYKGTAVVNKQQASLNLENTKLDYAKAQQDLVVDVYTAYLNYLKAEKLLAVNKEAVNQGNISLSQVKKKMDAGMATQLDVLKAETQLADLEKGLLKAENSLKLAASSLGNLLGVEISNYEGVKEVNFAVEKPSILNDYLNQAQTSRQELKQNENKLKINELSLWVTEHQQKPLVTLGGDYSKGDGRLSFDLDNHSLDLSSTINYTSSDNEKYVLSKSKDEADWKISLRVDIALWDGGAGKEQLKQANSQLEQGKLELKQQQQQITFEVQQAYLAVDEAYDNVEVGKKYLRQAEESLRVTEKSYHAEVSPLQDLLTAQLNLLKARTDDAQAAFDYYIANLKLKKATGVLDMNEFIGGAVRAEK